MISKTKIRVSTMLVALLTLKVERPQFSPEGIKKLEAGMKKAEAGKE